MSQIEANQPHVLDLIEAYLGDDLSPVESGALESHVAECAGCSEALAEARETDADLRNLFEDVVPVAGFEDRIVHRLRNSRGPHRRILHPMVLRTAAGVAAAVLIAGTGMVVTNVVQGDGSPFAWIWQVGVRNSAKSEAYSALAVSSDSERVPILTKHQMDGFENPQGLITHAGTINYSQTLTDQIKPDTATIAGAGTLTLSGANTDTRSMGAQGVTSSLTLNGGSITNSGSVADLPVGGINYLQNQGEAVRSNTVTNASGLTLGSNAATIPVPQLETAQAQAFQPKTQLGSNASARGLLVARNPTAKINEPELAMQPVKTAVSAADGGTLLLGGQKVVADVDADGSRVVVRRVERTDQGTSNIVPAAVDAAVQQVGPNTSRKVIRNGSMEFDVDRFDDALVRVTRLVGEQRGYVATTDSDKLADGRVRGTLTLRVPADRLDTLVLTLRGIGDIKSQKLTAEDVTKHFSDLESELRADRAMEERLLDIIKTGKGEIKDLLAAEKELSVWRGKIEAIEGERRYIENQVSLSTLVVTLDEKLNKIPVSASESEHVDMSLETEKVDDAYGKAMEAISAAKGRIMQSELKQYDAGQFGATIVAAIPPDAAEQVIARLRQLDGRIAHFARERKQSLENKGSVPLNQNNGTVPLTMLNVEREDAIVSMQIYNLANVAPRRTTAIKLAVPEVDKAFEKLSDLVRADGGRIVTSSSQRPDANVQSAEMELQVPSDKADAALDSITGLGELMRQESAENPDTANVTESKRGFRVSLISLATVPPRENQTLQLAAANVTAAFNDIVDAVRKSGGRVIQSDLNEQNPQDVTGTLVFEISRTASPTVDGSINKSAQVLTRTINHSTNSENTVDTKLRMQLSLLSAARLAPRQTTTIREEVSDVERCVDDVANAAITAGGRRLGDGALTQDRAGHVTAQVIVEVPMDKAGPILDQIEQMGSRRGKQVAFDTAVPDGPLARARIDVTFSNSAASLGGEETAWDAIRDGLSTSGKGLRWSVQMLVIGFCSIAPWGLMLWFVAKLIRRSRNRAAKAGAAPAA